MTPQKACFQHVFCSCKPSWIFSGTQATLHRKKAAKDGRHQILRAYYLCLCNRGIFCLPPIPTEQEISEFNKRHKKCVQERKARITKQKEQKIYSARKEREKLNRFFAEMETSKYLEDRKIQRNESLMQARMETQHFPESTTPSPRNAQEDEMDRAIRSITEQELSFLQDLTQKDSEMVISCEGAIVEQDIRQIPSTEKSNSELKDLLSREKKWREVADNKVKQLEEKMKTMTNDLENEWREIANRERVLKRTEQVLKYQKNEIRLREEKLKEKESLLMQQDTATPKPGEKVGFFHIPISDNSVAGEPFFIEDITNVDNDRCFGNPVKTCAHLKFSYSGIIKETFEWKNEAVKPQLILKDLCNLRK
ncbi:MAG: hypothetical protein AAGC43_18080 [Bacteroidota bacterium]